MGWRLNKQGGGRILPREGRGSGEFARSTSKPRDIDTMSTYNGPISAYIGSMSVCIDQMSAYTGAMSADIGRL